MSFSGDTPVDAGSFRDPAGQVFVRGDKVFRTVNACAIDDWRFVAASGVVERLAAEGRLVATREVDRDALGAVGASAAAVLEHEKLPFISYPYEWPFAALKAAALLHLDLQVELLESGIAFSDATAYNVQFKGAAPIFIDALSLRRYREGEFWAGHRQFCEQFLNPLLLRGLVGIPHNAWYRGSLEGISSGDLSRMLKFRQKISPRVFTQVVLQASLQRAAMGQGAAVDGGKLKQMALPRRAYQGMLLKLRDWIATLQPADGGASVWRDYANAHSYSSDEAQRKRAFVAAYAEQAKPALMWDIGCNSGDYSVAAIEAGAGYVVGFDFDQGALDRAFDRAQQHKLPFQPLFLDAANPSPDQGWRQAERSGMQARSRGNGGVLALALIHHLAIARNIPLPQVLDWLVGMAPSGVLEFVPKNDPMVQELLKLREDIFPDYTVEAFEAALAARARIVRKEVVSASNRVLFQFDR